MMRRATLLALLAVSMMGAALGRTQQQVRTSNTFQSIPSDPITSPGYCNACMYPNA